MARWTKYVGAAAGVALTLGALAPVASAQQPPKKVEEQKLNMPSPKKSDPDPPTLWAYLAILIILGSVFGANMIPSKRGHQD